MTILSLNTWGGQLNELFFTFIRKHAYEIDVYCFQEVFENADAEKLRDVLGPVRPNLFSEIQNTLTEHVGYYAPSQKDDEGLAIFVRKGINVNRHGDEFVYRWLDAMENDDGRTIGRNIQYVEVEENGNAKTIVNFHGLWAGKGVGKGDLPKRIEQSTNIKTFLDTIPKKKILIGDFNYHPDTQSLAILEDGMVNLIKTHDIKTTRSEHYKKNRCLFADYALVSPDIRVKDFRVLSDPISDHLPLYLEVE